MIIKSSTLALIVLCVAYAYQFIALCQVFGRGKWRVALLVFLAAMLGAYCFRRYPGDNAALVLLLQAGFFYMPFGLALSGFLLGTAVCRMSGKWCGLPPDGKFLRLFAPKRAAALSVCGALLLALYGLYSAYHVTTQYLTLQTDKLPPGQSIRLAVVSDVHVSHLGGPALVSRIVDAVNAAQPDIFISLGDLTDKDIPPGSAEARLLRGIHTRYGSYGVLGNHEFYYNLPLALQFHQDAGITLLRGTAVDVGTIRLIGTDDPEGVKRGYISTTGREPLLQAVNPRYSVVLYHQPHVARQLIGLFDLQLSGHTHGGQAWPVNLYVKAVHPYSAWRQATLTGENGQSELFVTHGAGFNGPPFRLFVPAEVVIIDIKAAGKAQSAPMPTASQQESAKE